MDLLWFSSHGYLTTVRWQLYMLCRLTFNTPSMIVCKGICGWVLIEIVDWHSSNTLSSPQLTLDWHLGEQHVDQYVWVSRHPVDYVSTECQPSIDWDVDQVSIKILIECQSRANEGYRTTLYCRCLQTTWTTRCTTHSKLITVSITWSTFSWWSEAIFASWDES